MISSPMIISERSSSASKDILKDNQFIDNEDMKKYLNGVIERNSNIFKNLNEYQENFIFL